MKLHIKCPNNGCDKILRFEIDEKMLGQTKTLKCPVCSQVSRVKIPEKIESGVNQREHKNTLSERDKLKEMLEKLEELQSMGYKR